MLIPESILKQVHFVKERKTIVVASNPDGISKQFDVIFKNDEYTFEILSFQRKRFSSSDLIQAVNFYNELEV